jgi:hypothetical protein
MSGDLDYTNSFRESNSEILNIIKHGSYKQDETWIREILEDRGVKSKIQKMLDYYSKPNDSSKKRLESGSLKLLNLYPLTTMLKTFILHLSEKLKLDEELAFRLIELFFTTHPHILEKVKNSESEESRKELSSMTKPLILLYYKERINLVKSVTSLVMNTTNENNPCQRVFMEYLETTFDRIKLIDLAWKQFVEVCSKDIPSSLYSPNEREEWYLQVLEEQKCLLELLIFCNYTEAHPTASNYLTYLDQYLKQGFKGSLKIIEKDLHISAYRQQQQKIIEEIGDLCLFHLLSSIKLDIFNERGAIPEFDENRNPYNLLSDQEFSPKLQRYFVTLRDNSEFLDTEHLGPVLVSWIALLIWARGIPSDRIKADLDTKVLEELAGHFYVLEFLHDLTKRAPFQTASEGLSCALKYILMTLISKIHSTLSIENSKNYSLLVKTTSSCLESFGSNETLKHFWKHDFNYKNGLYLMLDLLSQKYPNDADDFLRFVYVLTGDTSCGFAKQIVDYLSNLHYFTVSVGKDCFEQVSQNKWVSVCELSSTQIVIPKGTEILKMEPTQRNQFLVTWKIRYSLWPVLFSYWESNLQRMKQGHSLNDGDMRMFAGYLDILCKLIILDPRLSSVLEENGLRQLANVNMEMSGMSRRSEVPNMIITTYLLETFIELSRMNSPSLNTLSSILESLKFIYSFETENLDNNPVRLAFRQVFLDRHGYGGPNSPHPLFLSLNKLRVTEKSLENYSVTYSMLEFCNSIFSEDTCMRVFPLSSSILSESLKYSLSEVPPEVFQMSGLYKWRNSHLLLSLIHTLLNKCFQFLTSSLTPCAYIELLTNQLNKVAISGLLETVLHVGVHMSEFNEVSFINLHASQTDDFEETALILVVVTSALKVLQKVLDIVLFACENKSISINLQATNDVYRLIFSNSSGEELPLVSALMSYVPFYADRAMPEDRDDENLAVLALRCLTKIVLIWSKSGQKNSLDYYTTGNLQELRKQFFKCFEKCFVDKNSSIPHPIRHLISSSFLEFIIIAIPTQKNFITGILNTPGVIEQVSRNFMFLRNLPRESISSEPLVTYFELVYFIEQLVVESKKYSSLVVSIFQEAGVFSKAVETAKILFVNKKNFAGFEVCVVEQCFASIFRILTLYVQQNQGQAKQEIMKIVFNSDILNIFWQVTGRIFSNESSVNKIKDIERYSVDLGLPLNTNEFIVMQSHSDPAWKLFQSNPHQYGKNLKYNYLRLQILLSSHEVPLALIKEHVKAFKILNLELSLVDSQYVALSSFRTLLAYSSSFGISRKLNSALHRELGQSCSYPLLMSGESSFEASVKEVFELLQIIVERTWNSIKAEKNLIHPDVICCLDKKFEILFYSFSFIIHISAVKMQSPADGVPRDRMKKLATRILSELLDFLNQARQLTVEMISFLHSFLSYFAKTEQFESTPDESFYGLIVHLSRFIQHDSSLLHFLVSCLEYTLNLSDRFEYVNLFRSLQCNRVIIEKLADDKCSEIECLFILRFLMSFCKTAPGAKYVLSLRLFPALSNCKLLRQGYSEYEGRKRSPNHVLWCWVMNLLVQISEVSSNDQISISQVLSFVSEFNVRVSSVFEFNFLKDSGQIFGQKQFSLAYLEELEVSLALLVKLVDAIGYLKKNDQEKLEYWISVVSVNCLRIFNVKTDILHCFPPVTEVDLQNSTNFNEQKMVAAPVWEEGFVKRNIFDPAPRVSLDNRQKKSASISVYLYKVQNMLNLILENILTVVVNYFQMSKCLPNIDPANLVGASKFLLSNFSLVSSNPQIFDAIDKKCVEVYSEPEYSSMNGGLNSRYEVNNKRFLMTCKKNFEMVFYVIMKFDLNKVPDLKSQCFTLIKDWIKLTDQGHMKGELKDHYLAYILDQLNTY